MTDKETLRLDTYRAADERVRVLYGSSELGAELRRQFDTLGISEDKYAVFVDIFGDVILGIEPASSIVPSLIAYITIDQTTAQRIFDSIAPLLELPITADTVAIPDIDPDNFKPVSVSPAPLRVMPHTPQEAAASQARSGTELPNSLLRNLQASLAHSDVPDPDVESAASPAPSYTTFLNKPPTQ